MAQANTIFNILREKCPDLASSRSLCDLIYQDIQDRGLVNHRTLDREISPFEMKAGLLTEIGRRFLAYVADPPGIA